MSANTSRPLAYSRMPELPPIQEEFSIFPSNVRKYPEVLPMFLPILEARFPAHDDGWRRTKAPLRAATEYRLYDGRELFKCRGLILPCNGATLQRSGGAIDPKAVVASRSQCTRSARRSFACNVRYLRQFGEHILRASFTARVESPGRISPPGAHRTVHDPLESHGSRCSAAAVT